jgi:DNA-binding sugar fermentation-stimulating protein
MRLKPVKIKKDRSIDVIANGQEVTVHALKSGGLCVTVYTKGNTGEIKEASHLNSKSYLSVSARDKNKSTNVVLVTSHKNKKRS